MILDSARPEDPGRTGILDAFYMMLDNGYWILDTGFWFFSEL